MSNNQDLIKTNEPTIVVWFSCGAASAVAAKKTIEDYGSEYRIRVVNNPILEEDSDNQRFLKDVESWLGIEIEYATNPKFSNCSTKEVWDWKQYMSGPAGAPCTKYLKKYARQIWENNNHFDYIVLGFPLDEKKRHDNFILTERDDLLPVLINHEITKINCYEILDKEGIKLPRMYRLGYNSSNCIGCVKVSSPTYWNKIRETHPEVFKDRMEQSRKVGAKLTYVKGEKIFLDELDPNYKGNKFRNTIEEADIECGSFCEEPLNQEE